MKNGVRPSGLLVFVLLAMTTIAVADSVHMSRAMLLAMATMGPVECPEVPVEWAKDAIALKDGGPTPSQEEIDADAMRLRRVLAQIGPASWCAGYRNVLQSLEDKMGPSKPPS